MLKEADLGPRPVAQSMNAMPTDLVWAGNAPSEAPIKVKRHRQAREWWVGGHTRAH